MRCLQTFCESKGLAAAGSQARVKHRNRYPRILLKGNFEALVLRFQGGIVDVHLSLA